MIDSIAGAVQGTAALPGLFGNRASLSHTEQICLKWHIYIKTYEKSAGVTCFLVSFEQMSPSVNSRETLIRGLII